MKWEGYTGKRNVEGMPFFRITVEAYFLQTARNKEG